MLLTKLIFAAIYITGSIIYDHDSDPLMPLLPERSQEVAPSEWKKYNKALLYNDHKNEVIYIGISFILLFRFIDTILFLAIKVWSSDRQNFVKKGINPDNSMLNCDDNLTRRYMSQESIGPIFGRDGSLVRDEQNWKKRT